MIIAESLAGFSKRRYFHTLSLESSSKKELLKGSLKEFVKGNSKELLKGIVPKKL